eukprot:CAMPEP_0119321790 /NCGR_PEP_ID=MMETSP1333-20130426/56447_1 /TAXON_ID=418940 /ORGANISM="Scyphosphaera apsteinii, Strain RCC1455" /LENGTH=346 /DNA_ID=CAMNT_0007328849 /DNA_START=31 /DNA_END=1068 /DNA_ORIENTATION=+
MAWTTWTLSGARYQEVKLAAPQDEDAVVTLFIIRSGWARMLFIGASAIVFALVVAIAIGALQPMTATVLPPSPPARSLAVPPSFPQNNILAKIRIPTRWWHAHITLYKPSVGMPKQYGDASSMQEGWTSPELTTTDISDNSRSLSDRLLMLMATLLTRAPLLHLTILTIVITSVAALSCLACAGMGFASGCRLSCVRCPCSQSSFTHFSRETKRDIAASRTSEQNLDGEIAASRTSKHNLDGDKPASRTSEHKLYSGARAATWPKHVHLFQTMGRNANIFDTHSLPAGMNVPPGDPGHTNSPNSPASVQEQPELRCGCQFKAMDTARVAYACNYESPDESQPYPTW